MLTLRDIFFAFIWIALLILAGRIIKQKVGWIQRLYLPESIVAGVLALLLGPQVLGAITTAVAGEGAFLSEGLFSEPIRETWSSSPGIFINIVFAALFLGETIPSPKQIWRRAAPQVVFGQSLAWGQYVVGILATLFILIPLFDANPISGALIEIGFEGGHGTAGGMASTFADLGFEEGADLALGLATVGIVTGIISGTLLADWARKKQHISVSRAPEDTEDDVPQLSHDDNERVRERRAHLTRGLLIDPLSLNFGFVGIAVIFGWLIQQALILIENLTWASTGFTVMEYIPLFPMALIGGILVQLIMVRLNLDALVIPRLTKNIAGTALDVVVVTALASISLQVLGGNLGIFLTLSILGIAWNIAFFLWFAPRLFPDYWFEKGIGDLGQSMGVTATGILLMRMVDPENRSGAFESFAYKQLFFEPIVGGGLFTAASPALIASFGLTTTLLITAGLLVFWIVAGLFLVRQDKRAAGANR
ncbi:Sodium/glutamate symporter superfamily [Synechococcus sp. PCC 7335]|uniref:sodium/glutamate symporter n=1 Tax=Synechococcus sp. (strain ATCC 29403 / PCC 7335) TaxID=91464 RepID=UPI00017ED22E|nr:sodium/glutamate symporter [Synechococcus sp. PCC 7335]EDX86129.1 Sodium/glutamate symporter superfamily [Synechococcus sp. PCC 7335]